MEQSNITKKVDANQKARGLDKQLVVGDGVVITAKNYVVGSNGTGHWFQLREKYCFTGTLRKLVECRSCNKDTIVQKLKIFYKIDIDGEEFEVCKDYLVEYNQPIDNTVANKGVYEDWLQPKIVYPDNNDYVKATEEITGMKNKTSPDYRDDSVETETNKQNQFKTIEKSVSTNSINETI